ncbi:HAD family hydrolase [Streptomyces sp. NPDC002073]|uniref:HAD family hydrolase n=1 Tax=Streptomyces sp. NBC_00239 TaxID=2903640 RepID=UPI002E2BDFC8|nr:HAD family hydrolase [Streptomyces sp. NBC_00239]
MINPTELVIFDCDGVLVDSERIFVRLQVALGAELGWPLTHGEAIDRFVGRSRRSITEQIAARLGDETAGIWWDRLVHGHREAVEAELAPVEGIFEALEGLAAMALPICVASNGRHEKVRQSLRRTGLYERFAGRVFSATDVARGKPAPDLFLHAAERMGVDPAACAVIEDSRSGVAAARSAGMRAFGYAGGLTPAEWLAGPGTVVFDDMRELPVLLVR